MAFLKLSLIALIVTSLSVSADPLKQKPQTLNILSTKNAQQQVANEAKPDVIPIYVYSRENSLDGDYNFKYETGNGIFAEERGVVVNKGTEDEANSVVGSYRYVSPEGVPIEVTYTAGVDGFRAYGAHLPVAPPAAALPKNLAFKNAALSPFARPQFRAAVDDSDSPALRTVDDDDDQQATSQSARNLAGAPSSNGLERPATRPDAEAAANELSEKPLVLLVGSGAEQSTTADKPSSQLLTGETPTATNEVENSQKIDSVFDIKKPLTAEYYQQFNALTPTTSRDQLASNPQTWPDQSGFLSSTTSASVQQQQQQQQQRLQSVENFESLKPTVSVVPVLQTVPQAVQTQPKVVPVLQRVVPGEEFQQYQQQQQQQQQQYLRQPFLQQPYHQQPYQQQPYLQQPYQQQKPFQQQQQQKPFQQQQQQTRFNARPFPPAFGQQPRPAGSVRQFSVEPQQMWYVPQNQQPARHFQMPTVPRTLELPKY